MAFIYRKYQENHFTKKEVNIHFFFHGSGTTLQKTPFGIFRSLVHQLYENVKMHDGNRCEEIKRSVVKAEIKGRESVGRRIQ